MSGTPEEPADLLEAWRQASQKNGPDCQIELFSHLKYYCKVRQKWKKKGGWVGY